MVVPSQRLIELYGIRLNGCGPFKVEMISDEWKKPIVRDVQRGKLRRLPFSFKLVSRAFLVLAPLQLRLTFYGRLATLGGDHYGM